MNAQYAQQFAAQAGRAIDGFDSVANKAIGAWRDGSDKLGVAAKARWDEAFEASRPKLSAETRKNAAHARKVFSGYYSKGTSVAASGAEIAVATMVQAARVAVERASNWQPSRG